MTEPTRAQYMNREVTHEAYYSAVAKTAGIDWTDHPKMPRIRELLAAGDEHLNQIPLNWWDAQAENGVLRANMTRALRAHGDGPSLAGFVCILKTAATLAANTEPRT